MRRGKRIFISIFIVCCLLSSCGVGDSDIDNPKQQTSESSEEQEVLKEDIVQREEVLLWLAYWNYNGYTKEMEYLGDCNDAVSVFGVLFDVDGDKPILLPQVKELLSEVVDSNAEDKKIYLSFVNDLQLSDGSYSNKDPELLVRLLAQQSSREEHINDIINIALRYNVDGIEIDYENIKKKNELWEPFCLFLDQLKTRCDEEGLLLRVVLGAYDVDKADFPKDIEYSVMCYNLYGTHSGPGPKADIEFLKGTFERCQKLQGEVSAAFSTGGFMWAGDKCLKALTEREAVEIYSSLGESVSELKRDPASGALNYYYEEEGIIYEVWYSDGETLKCWKGIAEEYGISKFSLWKAGGNLEDSFLAFS